MAVNPQAHPVNWKQATDTLHGCLADPNIWSVPEEGIPGPTAVAVHAALEYVGRAMAAGDAAPDWVSTDGEGGVTFEWFEGKLHRSMRFEHGGEVLLLVFEDGNLLKHEQVS